MSELHGEEQWLFAKPFFDTIVNILFSFFKEWSKSFVSAVVKNSTYDIRRWRILCLVFIIFQMIRITERLFVGIYNDNNKNALRSTNRKFYYYYNAIDIDWHRQNNNVLIHFCCVSHIIPIVIYYSTVGNYCQLYRYLCDD